MVESLRETGSSPDSDVFPEKAYTPGTVFSSGRAETKK
jgi:hypothetical protein